MSTLITILFSPCYLDSEILESYSGSGVFSMRNVIRLESQRQLNATEINVKRR